MRETLARLLLRIPKRRTGVSLVLVGGVIGLTLAGCRSDAGKQDANSSASGVAGEKACVLLVGVDGLEWNVVLPLIREGRMPNLERLMERGVFGMLRTYAPAKSPVIWTTIATGKVPEKHGITDFFKNPDSKAREFFTSRDRKTKALWNILSDAGRTMHVVGWWNTYPVEAINGVMVAQTNTISEIKERRVLKGGLERGVDGQVHPERRQNEMLNIFAQVESELPAILKRIFGEIQPVYFEPNRINWERCSWAFRADESYRRIALRLASERPLPDCLAVYFGVPDIVGHRFWRFHEPEVFKHPPKPNPLRKFGAVIKDAYANFDAALGELVAALPKNATILVVSDHGMHATHQDEKFDVERENGAVYLESGAHVDGPPGLFVACGPPFRQNGAGKPVVELTRDDLAEIGSVIDIAPTILVLLGVPVGRDMNGTVLDNWFNPTFAQATKVEYVSSHDTPQWLAERTATTPELPGAKERIEQLRALGYIGSLEDEQPGSAAASQGSTSPSKSE